MELLTLTFLLGASWTWSFFVYDVTPDSRSPVDSQ